MAVYVECGNAGAGGVGIAMPVEIGSEAHWVQSLEDGEVSASGAPRDCVMTLTADAPGFATFGLDPTSPRYHRRRILQDQPRSFAVRKDEKVRWEED